MDGRDKSCRLTFMSLYDESWASVAAAAAAADAASAARHLCRFCPRWTRGIGDYLCQYWTSGRHSTGDGNVGKL